MAQTKYKSLEAIKASIRAGRKYAMENNPPEDPTEEKVPELDKENIVSPSDYGIPGEDKKNVNEVENSIPANTPLDQTMQADESDVDAEEKKPVETTEKEVSMPEIPEDQKADNIKEAGAKLKNALADLIKKAKEAKAEKEAKEAKEDKKDEAKAKDEKKDEKKDVEDKKEDKSTKVAKSDDANVASGIDLSALTLSKIASMMLETEQGRQLAVKTLEANKAEQIKAASLKELLIANEMFKQEESLRKTAAYKEAEAEFLKIASAHESEMDKIAAAYEKSDPELAQAIKLAYAQGATDAAAIQEGAQPAPEAVPTPEQEQSEVMQVIDELVQSGQISPEQAQALAQLAQEVAMQDQNPELSAEEEQLLLQQAVEQGLIPQEVLQQLMGGQAAPEAAAAPAPDAAPASEEAAAMQAAPSPMAEAAKTAAEKVLKTAYILKKAAADEGIVEDAEPSIEDVETIIDQLEESGQISAEEAEAIKEEVADAISDEIIAAEEKSGEAPVAEKEVEVKVSPEAEEGEVSPEELSAFLAEQGVTPEELEAALAGVEADESESACDEEEKKDDKEEDKKDEE